MHTHSSPSRPHVVNDVQQNIIIITCYTTQNTATLYCSWYRVCLCRELECVLDTDSFIELSFTLAFQLEIVSKVCL